MRTSSGITSRLLHAAFFWMTMMTIIGFAQAKSDFSFAQGSYAQKNQIFNFKDARGDDVQIMTSRFSIPQSKFPELLKSVPMGSKQSLVVSFPKGQIEELLRDNHESLFRAKNNYLIPYSPESHISKGLDHIKATAKDDPIGVMVVVVNTAVDSFIWWHVDSLSSSQKVSMTIFNIVVAATLSLDKDLWPNMTKPLAGRFEKMMDKLVAGKETTKKLTASFLSNLVFSVGLQTLRMTVVSFPTLLTSFSSASFWGTSLLMGSILTFSSFSWGDQLAKIDKDENPMAKTLLRRFMEVRSVTMGYTAPTGRLLHPDVHGWAPWVLQTLHGAVGVWFMLNSEKIVDKMESNRLLKKLYKFHIDAELWAALKFDSLREKIRACRSVI